MARPPAKELTERELEIMQVFWRRGELGVADVQKDLAENGLERAYTTVATLVRILADKGFLAQVNEQRPFIYRPVKSYEEVSGKLLADLVERVFDGSRERLLVRLLQQKKLSTKERAALEEILRRGANREITP
ncbi:MAG: BlaI/MecI/CopY family transcriptional regulator [Pirellulales bacterium]